LHRRGAGEMGVVSMPASTPEHTARRGERPFLGPLIPESIRPNGSDGCGSRRGCRC
jgi:hypothetical protein